MSQILKIPLDPARSFAKKLRRVVRKINPHKATNEQMLQVFISFIDFVAEPSMTKFPFYTETLQKDLSNLKAIDVPQFHLFFTLRPLDYLDLVGLGAAGIFPIRILTTQRGDWDSAVNSNSWIFTTHDFNHTKTHLLAIEALLKAYPLPEDKMLVLEFEYGTFKQLATEALTRSTPSARLKGLGALFMFSHEYNRSTWPYVQAAALEPELRAKQRVFMRRYNLNRASRIHGIPQLDQGNPLWSSVSNAKNSQFQ